MKLTIIIPNRNKKGVIIKTLESIKQFVKAPHISKIPVKIQLLESIIESPKVYKVTYEH